jgi:hypothetical protein
MIVLPDNQLSCKTWRFCNGNVTGPLIDPWSTAVDTFCAPVTLVAELVMVMASCR